MLFDDRLATVLRSLPQGDNAARTQFRQLIDLLGSTPDRGDDPVPVAAYDRLGALAGEISPQDQSAILRQPGLRLRNRQLVLWLAQREPQCAAAAMATARLPEHDWLEVIPQLPITARGFLRHRRDLPQRVRQLLQQLGVGDLVLPEPPLSADSPVPSPARQIEFDRIEPPREPAEAAIGELVRRIESFRQARRAQGIEAPQLPLEDTREVVARRQAFDFSTDVDGAIDWADPILAPLAVGLTLGPVREGSVAEADARSLAAMSHHQPVRDGTVTIAAAQPVAGSWRIDATPRFAPDTGAFAGYVGRMQRRAQTVEPAPAEDSEQDRIRQLLHELRTPVNAIQGFAEIIQQQLFGAAPNEYRALAAGVAVDAARLLAGFDEIDRLARLESGALDLDAGASDLRETITHILRRLEGALRPRNAAIEFECSAPPFLTGLADDEALRLVWRLLATLAGALAAGERITLTLEGGEDEITLEAELPATLSAREDLFTATGPQQARAISAGMFGTGFALRLARAEAQSTGGALLRASDCLILTLPVSAAREGGQSATGADNGTEKMGI